MSESREANVAKVLMYILVPIGAVVALYFIVKQLLTGGGEAFLELYKTQLMAYIEKMEGYAKENNGVLNPAQEASRQDEVHLMGATQANAAQAFNDPWKVIDKIVGIGVAVLSIVYIAKNLPSIITKWKPLFENPNTQPKSAQGLAKMYDCVLVDQLALQGYTVAATNFLSTLQSSWYATDVPQMQATMASLQAQIDAGILSGIELSMAQATIQAYTWDIAMMPTIFAIPVI